MAKMEEMGWFNMAIEAHFASQGKTASQIAQSLNLQCVTLIRNILRFIRKNLRVIKKLFGHLKRWYDKSAVLFEGDFWAVRSEKLPLESTALFLVEDAFSFGVSFPLLGECEIRKKRKN